MLQVFTGGPAAGFTPGAAPAQTVTSAPLGQTPSASANEAAQRASFPPIDPADRARLASLAQSRGFGEKATENLARSQSEGERAPEAEPIGLTEAEQEQVRLLSTRDREVRDHEEAHARVGGEFAGQPSYEFTQGPDGKNYAVAGQVAIDVSPVEGDPEATIRKMEVVKRAALAPAEPSGQDRLVAAQAQATLQQAVAELAAMRRAERAIEDEAPAVLNPRGAAAETGFAQAREALAA